VTAASGAGVTPFQTGVGVVLDELHRAGAAAWNANPASGPVAETTPILGQRQLQA
jgi:hypothetical protein